MHQPLPISGFVLAGGRSSRMGSDKALLSLAGKPLVQHALTKLHRICRSAAILTNNSALAPYGRLVPDLHPDCGPMSGLEAALAAAEHDWSLILPVDVPFTPTQLLYTWAQMTLNHGKRVSTRIALFEVDRIPQPTLVLIHRDIAPYLTEALAHGRYKLYPELQAAAAHFEQSRCTAGTCQPSVLECFAWTAASRFSAAGETPPGPAWTRSTPLQEASPHLYFANLNTPGEFAEAEHLADLLDT